MELSEEARAELQAALRSDYYDGSVSSRARIVLMYADGHQKSEIAKLLRTTRPTVDKWLKRYAEKGMAGLALDRTQPMLPVTFGKTSKWTHDYKRMGTTEMYAALDVRTGKVITSLSKEHKAPDFLRLMKKVKAAYPDKKIHVVLDNASAHTGSVSAEWLVKQQGNVEFHFTPTGASWLNIVEIFNGIITRKAIRCGSFSAVVLLNKTIEAFVEHWNEDCEPIEWTATADEIIEKVRYVTARMEQLVNAVQIGDVMDKAA